MAAEKRNKKRLSSVQADVISTLISAIFVIIILKVVILLKLIGEQQAVFAYVMTLMSYILGSRFLYIFIFKGLKKEAEERREKVEKIIEQNLSYTDFKLVYFVGSKRKDMVWQILENEGCKFYAKLTEDKNICLIAKDKHNEQVHAEKVENNEFFISNFLISNCKF